jgi:hypothetical protein
VKAKTFTFLLLLYFSYVGLLLVASVSWEPLSSLVTWLAALVAPFVLGLVVRMLRAFLVSKESKGGAERGSRVAGQVAGRGYTVLTKLDLQKGAVDHVVIGPSGVYAVTVKRWLTTARQSESARLVHGLISAQHVKGQALEAATLVRRRLASCGVEHHVLAVICAPKVAGFHLDMRDVHVVQTSALGEWVKGRRMRIPPDGVERVRTALVPFAPHDPDIQVFKPI